MKIVGISGSLRNGSLNRRLLHACAKLLPPDVEFEEASIDLPLFDDNHGDRVPDSVKTIQDLARNCDGLFITCPEHNWNMTAAMKNAIDWLSLGGKASALNNQVAALAGIGGGRLGSVRAQMAIRSTLLHDRVWVVPGPEVLIAPSENMFDEDGNLTGPIAISLVKDLLDELLRVSPLIRNK